MDLVSDIAGQFQTAYLRDFYGMGMAVKFGLDFFEDLLYVFLLEIAYDNPFEHIISPKLFNSLPDFLIFKPFKYFK